MENNLPYYKIFYAVAKTGNISKAAKELYISQPAISKAITKLEQNLGTLLFLRGSRGVTLTFEGELLYEQLKTAFSAIAAGENQIKNATELNMGHLRIGVSTVLCKYILLPNLKKFMSKYPYVKISIACHSTYEILKLLEAGDIDVGLIAKPPHLKHTEYYKFDEITDMFVCSPHYLQTCSLSRASDISDIVDKSTFMLLDKENVTRQYLDAYLTNSNLEIKNCIEVTSMDLLIEFAKIGIGIAGIVKEFVTEELENGSLIEIPLAMPMQSREVGFVCQLSPAKSKSLNFFLETMKE